MEKRKAIAVHHTATSTGSWDGPKAEANLRLDESESYYRNAFAWQDPDGDPTNKGSYKFIHHEVSADGTIGAANVKACQTGIAVLNGARGGTTIPAADRKGVWNHLAAHIRDAGLEPAELKSLEPAVERRFFPAEMRVERQEDGPVKLRGYAAVFNSMSEDLGGFREIIKPGAFAEALKDSDVRCLFNHDPNIVLGRQRSGTLELREDEKGLYMEVDLPDTQAARDIAVLVERGDITQQSFGFTVAPDGETWEEQDNGTALRTLTKVSRLYDVSPVVFPAYPETDVALRSMRSWLDSQKSSDDDKPDIEILRMKIRIEEEMMKRD